MKLLRTLTLLLTGLLFSLSASAQKATEPVAYRLVDSVGRPVTFDKLITRAAGADVVFFGELHNNPISHWMQLRVLEALQQRKGKSLTLGLEMLEADIQLILDEYLAKTISPKSYGDEARLWPNYETDYDPVVYFAKDHGLRVIATNVPRRYADLVNRKGLPALDSLSAEAKRYLPPLPIAFQSTEESAGMFAAMALSSTGIRSRRSATSRKLKLSRMPPWATASASTSALSTPSSTSTAPTIPCRMAASSPTSVATLPRHAS